MTHRWLSPFLALLVLAGATTLAGAQTAQNPRIALVIGESAYPDSALATPANDAALVAQTLQAAGFDVVGARDLDEKSVRAALRLSRQGGRDRPEHAGLRLPRRARRAI